MVDLLSYQVKESYKMYGYIYITTNLINNKQYIGQHKAEKFDIRYKGSGKILKKAFETYGWDNFRCEIIDIADSKDLLDLKEAYYIKKYDAVKSNEFYNLVPGGRGKSETGLIYITNGNINKKIHPQDLDYYLNQGYWKGGPQQTEATKIKRANSNRGKKHPTAGINISKALTGRSLSEDHRKKLSIAKKGIPRDNRKLTIRCIELNLIFKGYKEAADYFNIKATGYICAAVKHNRQALGYHWELVK